MSEMHLDLCIQSTNHLLDTVSGIKENIRILEVFLNSGLKPVDFIKPNAFMRDEYSSSEGRGSAGPENRFYTQLSETKSGNRHTNCCCMCHFRMNDSYRDSGRNGAHSLSESRASAATASNSGKSTSSHKKSPLRHVSTKPQA